MAITTLAGAIAGEQQPVPYIKIETASQTTWCDLWTDTPNAGTNTTGSANGVTYSSSSSQVAGQIYHVNPASGNCYISTIRMREGPIGSPVSGCGLVVDRIWQGGTYPATTTASQAITSPTWPARDINGATNGDGCIVYMSAVTSFTATTTVTLTYTNQSGTGSRTSTAVMASAGTRTVTFFGLQSGDTGVQSIQSVQVASAQAAGTYILAVVRPLAMFPADMGAKVICEDAITVGMTRLYDGSVPYLLFYGNGANVRIVMPYVETVG